MHCNIVGTWQYRMALTATVHKIKVAGITTTIIHSSKRQLTYAILLEESILTGRSRYSSVQEIIHPVICIKFREWRRPPSLKNVVILCKTNKIL